MDIQETFPLAPDMMVIVDYSPEYGPELVAMWRASFEQAVALVDSHSFAEQLQYLEEKVVRDSSVRVVLEETTSTIIGFSRRRPRGLLSFTCT